jgi:hypothetical protein
VHQVKDAMMALSQDVIALSELQIHSLLAVAPAAGVGYIQYEHFVPLVTQAMESLVDVDIMKTRFCAIQELSKQELFSSSLRPGTKSELLLALKQAFDASATHEGKASGARSEFC